MLDDSACLPLCCKCSTINDHGSAIESSIYDSFSPGLSVSDQLFWSIECSLFTKKFWQVQDIEKFLEEFIKAKLESFFWNLAEGWYKVMGKPGKVFSYRIMMLWIYIDERFC